MPQYEKLSGLTALLPVDMPVPFLSDGRGVVQPVRAAMPAHPMQPRNSRLFIHPTVTIAAP